MENSCFICEKTSNVIVYRENGFESRRCPECGLLYCNPLPADSQVDFEEDFHGDHFYKMPSQYKARWLSARTGTGKRLLEVGAGNGYLLKEFSDHGYHVTALEPNEDRIQRIKDHYQLEACQGYLESYDFKDRKFDVIFHVDLLAHFPEPLLAIEKMTDAIAPGGYIGFEVGVVGGISTFWYKLFPLGLPQHRWLYSKRSLEKLFEKANLSILYSRTHSLAPYLILKKLSTLVLIVVMQRLLSPFMGRRVSVFTRLHNNFSNFLRYKAGRYFPQIGPLTILYIVKPK